MEKKLTYVVWITILSLVLNIYTWRTLTEHKEALTRLNHSISYRTDNHLASQVAGLVQRVDQMREEQKWVTYTDFAADNLRSTREKIYMAADITLRETGKASKVFIRYKEVGGTTWQVAPAKHTDAASFQANLVVAAAKEYHYQVVEETSSGLKTSDVLHLPTHSYQPTPLYVGGMSHSAQKGAIHYLELAIEQPGNTILDFYRVAEVRAEFYENGVLTRTEVLLPTAAEWGNRWQLHVQSAQSYSRIVLEAEFADGTVQRRDIWPDFEQVRDSKFLFNP